MKNIIKGIGIVIILIIAFFVWGLTIHEHWLVSNVDYTKDNIVREKHTYVYHGDDFIIYANIIESTTKYILVQYDTFYTDGYHFDIYNGDFTNHESYLDAYSTVKFYKLKNENDVYVSASLTHKFVLTKNDDKRVFERASNEDVTEYKQLLKARKEMEEDYSVQDFIGISTNEDSDEDTEKETIPETSEEETTEEETTEEETTEEETTEEELHYSEIKEGIYLSKYSEGDITYSRQAMIEEIDSLMYIDIIADDSTETYTYQAYLKRENDGSYINRDDEDIHIYVNDDYITVKAKTNNFYEFLTGEYFYSDTDETNSGNNDYIFQDSDTRYLTDIELKKLNKEDLAFARNEIYARHGYIFKDQLYVDYFASKEWYIPQFTGDEFDDNVFNRYEKRNIELIKSYE